MFSKVEFWETCFPGRNMFFRRFCWILVLSICGPLQFSRKKNNGESSHTFFSPVGVFGETFMSLEKNPNYSVSFAWYFFEVGGNILKIQFVPRLYFSFWYLCCANSARYAFSLVSMLQVEDAGKNYLTIAPAGNRECRLQGLRGGHIAHALGASHAGPQESQGE